MIFIFGIFSSFCIFFSFFLLRYYCITILSLMHINPLSQFHSELASIYVAFLNGEDNFDEFDGRISSNFQVQNAELRQEIEQLAASSAALQ